MIHGLSMVQDVCYIFFALYCKQTQVSKIKNFIKMEPFTHNEILQQILKLSKESGRVENFSQIFSELEDDDKRVSSALDLLLEYKLCSLELSNPDDKYKKSASECVNLRISGNNAFRQKDYIKALLFYTQSIAKSPHPCANVEIENYQLVKDVENLNFNNDVNTELALALANRSAVLFSLGKYDHCMKDINLVLEMNYPSTLLYKLHERKGKCLLFQGELKAAACSFKNALDCLALASSLPDQKKQQLEEELTILMGQSLEAVPEKTSEHLVESQNDTPILPKISFGPNEKIPCASDCIDIHSSKDMGRCVVATRDINIGDVLGVEEPFASVLLPQFYYTHCYNCFLRCCTLLPCHYCSMVMYCSESCRKESWEKNHSVDCTLLPYLHKQDSNTIEMLAVRIIITASRDYESPAEFYRQVKSWKAGDSTTENIFDENGQYVSRDYKNIYNIVTNTEKRSVADLFKRAVTAARILQCFENKSNFFTSFSSNELLPSDFKLFIGGLLLRHLQNLPCNAHEVSESLRCENDSDVLKCVEIGAAAYATMSLVNHSCEPNVVRYSYRDTVVLRSIRLIKKGEQVLDNYGYHYALHEKEERQSHLKDQYYFTCDCEACHDDWPTYFNLNSDKPTYKCQTCGFSLPPQLVGEDVICEHCKCSNNIKEILTLLNESSKDYDRHLISVLSGSHDNAVVQQMIEHLGKLDQYIKRPWQEYNNCQEAIKQCYLKLGNYYESKLGV